MSPQAWIALVLFCGLMAALALHALAASGHFPRAHRAPALRTMTGSVTLFGSLAVGLACLAAGTVVAALIVPWYALVIGGGVAILVAPLLLQALPDAFVDGRAALLAFAAAAAALTAALAGLV